MNHTSKPASTVNHRVRKLLLTSLAIAAGAMAAPAFAADYPERPVKIIVNWPAGGPIDIIARVVAARMSTTLKQAFVVENVTGAAGNIGASAVARAQPDGYNILFSIDTPFTMTPLLSTATPYKLTELRPIVLMGSTASTLVVNPATGFKTLPELIAKGKQESLTFSSPGSGGPGHFAALMLSDATGVKVNPIHYRGNAPAVMAVVSGEVQAGILATAGLMPHIKSGKISALAAASSQRSTLLPEVPTAAELGVPGLELEFMFVALVPEKTPDAIVTTLRNGINEALQQPDIRERLKTLDTIPSTLGVNEVAAKLTTTRERYARIIKATGMKGEGQ
ncbi:MAG: tripartite tricarboxylate transporter substrate binding protein [Pseudomonadota bacterium]